jgi:hypothetical protein
MAQSKDETKMPMDILQKGMVDGGKRRSCGRNLGVNRIFVRVGRP